MARIYNALTKDLKHMAKQNLIKPPVQTNIDWTEVIASAEAYMDAIADTEEDEDDVQHLFEEVMTAIYGKDVFSAYINPMLK